MPGTRTRAASPRRRRSRIFRQEGVERRERPKGGVEEEVDGAGGSGKGTESRSGARPYSATCPLPHIPLPECTETWMVGLHNIAS